VKNPLISIDYFLVIPLYCKHNTQILSSSTFCLYLYLKKSKSVFAPVMITRLYGDGLIDQERIGIFVGGIDAIVDEAL
jgi:hypothetical protein